MAFKMASSSVSADNEWSPLRSVIVGRAGKACFPSERRIMIEATMPIDHQRNFETANPFPKAIVAQAEEELNQLAALLTSKALVYIGLLTWIGSKHAGTLEQCLAMGLLPLATLS